ncbi:hypothetical protein KDH_60300 [Dictyobacter sp. S3.2.2.5]|uniref:Tyr recombinase domain-containing protein n=1 Tax=Dictyobacter halimunensis TaxID=3026934 RepID=A0ABQ6G328_9CHLR|nr:hypothetical protein KDH_60300 [Dictyobacter sp. S3.2.2.5]
MEAGNVLRRSFKPLLDKARLPDIRFRDLRHSTATLLLTMDVHPKIVLELLGHSNISMTLDTYSHVLPSLQEQAVIRLNSLIIFDKNGTIRALQEKARHLQRHTVSSERLYHIKSKALHFNDIVKAYRDFVGIAQCGKRAK